MISHLDKAGDAGEITRRLEGIVASAMDGIITVDDEQRIILFNPAAERMFGLPAAAAMGQPITRFMPERFRQAHGDHIRRFAETGVTSRQMGSLGAISGLRANGEEFPIEASISQAEVGHERLSTVILRDITERKANEETRQLLAREVDHRAKNALAVVQALVAMTKAATKEEFIAAVRGRVSALGRAHSLLAQNRWEGGDLAQIVNDETAAYQQTGEIRAKGPPVVLRANAVQPISLLIHELATNAVKHGSLSTEQGEVRVGWRVLSDGRLEVAWTELGGPPVSAPAFRGFGSTLVDQMVTRQLGGALDMDWRTEGLRLVARLPATAYRLEIQTPPPPAVEIPEPVASPAPDAALGRLLVVEDEALIAMELCADLEGLGWEIIGPAATIEEALDLVATGPAPDAAVLDVNLGGSSIYPVARRLKAQGVPFVFCTGYEEIAAEPEFAATALVRKPISINLLDSELRRMRPAA